MLLHLLKQPASRRARRTKRSMKKKRLWAYTDTHIHTQTFDREAAATESDFSSTFFPFTNPTQIQ